jgi:hypothetical protein
VSHLCHAPGCKTTVSPKMFTCRQHWYALPKPLRDAIWREYRPGQEIDKQPSDAYLAVQRFACSRLAFKPNDAGAAKQSAALLSEALVYRRGAIESTGIDPLDGLLHDR